MRQIKLSALTLSEGQYTVMVALSNAHLHGTYADRASFDENGVPWYHVGTSQYTDAQAFIAKTSSAALRGLERRGLIKVEPYWRGAKIRAMVEIMDEDAAQCPLCGTWHNYADQAMHCHDECRAKEIKAMVERRRNAFRAVVKPERDRSSKECGLASNVQITTNGFQWQAFTLTREELEVLHKTIGEHLNAHCGVYCERSIHGDETHHI